MSPVHVSLYGLTLLISFGFGRLLRTHTGICRNAGQIVGGLPSVCFLAPDL
jgi:hypothetical protein